MSGWIKLYRQIIENPLYFSEPFSRLQAWIDLLLIANHKDGYFFKRGIKVNISVGQVGYDVDSLAKRWQWSRGKVERFLIHLESDGNIVRQKNNVTTLISIVKYKDYQTDDKPKDKPNKKPNSNPDGQQTGKQTDTNKNDKNEDNEKNEEEIDMFEKFWNLYDKKVGDKESLRKKFNNLSNEDIDKIFKYVPEYVKSQEDKKFRKNPQTFLNQKSWNDEIIYSPQIQTSIKLNQPSNYDKNENKQY